ncbi:MAG TPA: RHS repeat domain-containing protein [Chitinophagaceae bacterium]
MKNILGITVLLLLTLSVQSQYYYKDLVTVRQTNAQWAVLKNSKVRSVKLQSFEANNQPSEGFTIEQRISDNRVITSTNTISSGTSELTATYNPEGRLVQTIDTSEDFHSVTKYEYDANGRITSITNNSRSGEFLNSEVHVWSYDASGKPSGMLKIRNNSDTTYIRFVYDGKDVPVEEHATRKGAREPEIYYYYDDKNQLTDIVRYSVKARKLLPTHIFSYNTDGSIAGMLLIPEGSNEYQRWYYDYDERGLKIRERVFNKQQQLMGKVEYVYN